MPASPRIVTLTSVLDGVGVRRTLTRSAPHVRTSPSLYGGGDGGRVCTQAPHMGTLRLPTRWMVALRPHLRHETKGPMRFRARRVRSYSIRLGATLRGRRGLRLWGVVLHSMRAA